VSIGRRFYARSGIFGAFQTSIASRLAPAFGLLFPVGASLFAKNDDAVCRQNSKVLDNVTCRESPMETKNRLAAEV
jgi:hypothetical protein